MTLGKSSLAFFIFYFLVGRINWVINIIQSIVIIMIRLHMKYKGFGSSKQDESLFKIRLLTNFARQVERDIYIPYFSAYKPWAYLSS